MIYIASGSLVLVVGLIWLISPAKKPNPIYGYLSYLAQTNQESFKFAQKMASRYCMLYGSIQIALGLLIKCLNWDRYFMIWLLTFYIFFIFPIMSTERSLKKFLLRKHALPHDYIDPDKQKRERTKGFRDL